MFRPGPAAAQSQEFVGHIEGEGFTARGNVAITRDGPRTATALLSGSEVTVTGGHARITLPDGGEIDICGPAQLSVLKSGGAITLALSFGKVHARVSAELPLQIFTAMVVASPVSVGGLPRDAVVGLDARGEMCVYSPHGAVRLEHQFSGQKILVPQLGEVTVPGGQIENLREAVGACRCEIPAAAKREPSEAARPAEAPVRAKSEEPRREEAKKEEVVYTAVMPPLTFSADAPAPPPLPRVQKIKLLREVRLHPVRFSGRVERVAVAAKPPGTPRPVAVQSEAPPKTEATGFGAKLKNFFRRLFGRKTPS